MAYGTYYGISRGDSLDASLTSCKSESKGSAVFIIPENNLIIDGASEAYTLNASSNEVKEIITDDCLFASFVRGVCTYIESISKAYELLGLKMKDMKGKNVSVDFRNYKIGDQLLRISSVSKGQSSANIHKMFGEVKFFMNSSGRAKYLKGGDITSKEFGDIEDGLTNILQKDVKDYEVFKKDNDKNFTTSAVYVIDGNGVCFASSISESLKEGIQDDQLVAPFLTALCEYLNRTFKDTDLEYFELKRGSAKEKMCFRDFKLNNFMFRIVAIVKDGSVRAAKEKMGALKLRIVDHGWYKNFIDQNSRAIKDAQEFMKETFNVE
ncbi:MAG: hypothetical protein JW791_03045 [Nanoarchaeota archaeon]|nr:hypothetical protein [Nanoarchaeota archaeon]